VLQVRWLRAVAVLAATAVLMASSCSWQFGTPIPEGVPPPAGDPVPGVEEFGDDGRADVSGSASNKHAHGVQIPSD